MKIEPFPWFEGYLINMDELYTELTLEKIERKLLGEETWTLQTYKDMFNCNKSEHKNRKILIKADPGMGKTTLGRKVARDWAKGVFKKCSLVFFVALKFVKPGDTIENIIMQQIPELEGLKISQQKLKALLNRFSNEILIILDGLDEHRLGQNEDVIKIIKNQKLLDCRIVVSSRPHFVKEVEKHFSTIIRVEGFTETEARKFVSSFFTDSRKITAILQFKPSDSREDFPVHKCPILLSFLCLLVKENKIDLSETKLTVGDLYLRMVQCLYRKYTNRKGIGFVESEFVQVMKLVGILALRTLLSNNPLLQKSEVLEIAGEFAYEYGFFAGHEDFRLCTDPTADISVTYAHRSIEEFFGSFGFIQALDDGQSIDDILGSNCKEPIFMVNPLVLRFCLWLLTTTEFFGSRKVIHDKLVAYAAQRIDTHMLDTDTVDQVFLAIGIREALHNEDSLKLEFFKQVFDKCEQVRVFQIKPDEYKYYGHYQKNEERQAFCTHVLGVLGLISHSLLSKLSLLSISKDPAQRSLPDVNSDALIVSIDLDSDYYLEISKILLTNSDVLKRAPQVSARIYFYDAVDLKILMQKHTKELHLCSGGSTRLSVSGEFPFCPHFTHFTARSCQISNSVPAAFVKAVKEGEFPNLRRIELDYCTVNDCEWPEVPEFSWNLNTVKMCDSSQIHKHLLKLTELTANSALLEPLYADRLILVRLENLSVLELESEEGGKLQSLNDVLKQGLVPNLSALTLGRVQIKLDTFLREFDPNDTAKLEKLTLRRSIISAEELEIPGEKLTDIQLTELGLSGSFGLTGNLSALFTHSFPRLNSLILNSCDLNANDLQSLARANVEGKLPQLRHLDISYNYNVKISDMFTHSAQWNQLKTLDTADRNILNVESEFLTSLEELWVSYPSSEELGVPWEDENPLPDVTRCWSGLKTIELDYDADIPVVSDGVERGMFPDLTTVRLQCGYSSVNAMSFFKLLKANIVVIEKTF